ncbi:MAP7 domain-containing protein 1 isoform X2 [Chelonia mydas]|uniref:MAP7 domain-containing protein 1 isoform X2 n=1 Tax=Chelonia mydas TaxID=8469 RepID=UPI001CA87632|nr:MAP7 domain-containing protein 1 isoform X2 [Chelonia mydas]
MIQSPRSSLTPVTCKGENHGFVPSFDCMDLFFPGASKQSIMSFQPAVSHPSIYIDTNGQPSSLPDVEGSAVPRLAVQSPDPSVICEYSRGEGQSSSAESGPELRTPEMSAMSPPLRNESLVSYASMSEEEEREGQEVDGCPGAAMGLQPGPEPQLSAEESAKASRQAMLIRRCNSQGSMSSLPEDTLNHVDAHADWAHEGVSDLPSLGRVLDASQPEEEEGSRGPEVGSLPRVLMGPTWEKQQQQEEEQQQQARSPLHGALTEESLPSSASPQEDQPPAPVPPSRGLGCSWLREGRRESWRTNIHRLLDLEEQWDQLYHQELAMWQEERATQREERARDRELQFRLLGVLTDIRDELRYLRQERASARQSQAPPAEAEAGGLLDQPPKAEVSFPGPTLGSAGWGGERHGQQEPLWQPGAGAAPGPAARLRLQTQTPLPDQ